MRKRGILAMTMIFLVFIVAVSSANKEAEEKKEYVPGELLIKYRDDNEVKKRIDCYR
jgi:hypothetical protein